MNSADAEDVWNDIRRGLFLRTDAQGNELGLEELDPLLWGGSTYLLCSPRYDQVEALLTRVLRDDLLSSMRDALRRAILQRDLWAVFDWLVQHADDEQYRASPREIPAGRAMHLAVLLARVMQRVALSEAAIDALPDFHAAALASKSWPIETSDAAGDEPFLPPDLFDATGSWILLGSSYDLLTPLHARHFHGRSVFSVHLHLPGGRADGLEYLRRLREFPSPVVKHDFNSGERVRPPDARYLDPETPQFPAGTAIALVRRAILFDAQGRLHATRLLESIQIRRFRTLDPPVRIGEYFDSPRPYQQLVEFVLDRDRLFSGESGGLRAVASGELGFPQFMTHDFDPLEGPSQTPPSPRFDTCMQCHGAPGIFSVQTYTRMNTGMGTQLASPAPTPRHLDESKAELVDSLAVSFTASSYSWGVLRGLWMDAK